MKCCTTCCCCCELLKSCPALCNPMDCSLPGSSVHGILQARTMEWVAISFSRGTSLPRDWTHTSYVSCIARWILYYWATWEALFFIFKFQISFLWVGLQVTLLTRMVPMNITSWDKFLEILLATFAFILTEVFWGLSWHSRDRCNAGVRSSWREPLLGDFLQKGPLCTGKGWCVNHLENIIPAHVPEPLVKVSEPGGVLDSHLF